MVEFIMGVFLRVANPIPMDLMMENELMILSNLDAEKEDWGSHDYHLATRQLNLEMWFRVDFDLITHDIICGYHHCHE